MTLELYSNFSKRRNSTKIPTSTPAQRTVHLKTPTDMDKPTFLLDGTLDNSVNYVKFNGAYYYVNVVRSVANNLWEIECSMDELATFKTDIGNTVANIAFSSTGYDINMIDSRIAIKSTKQIYSPAGVASGLSSTGCYILHVMNQDTDSASNGMATGYALNDTSINKLRHELNQGTVWQDLQQLFGKAMDSILSLIWIPVPIDSVPKVTDLTVINIGNHSISGLNNVKLLQQSSVYKPTEVTITLPFKYNDFRDGSPYTTATLYLPTIGNIDLNMSDLMTDPTMSIELAVDCANGDAIFYIKNYDGYILQTVTTNLGVNTPLAQTTSNVRGGVAGLGTAVGGAATAMFSGFTGNIAGFVGGASALLAGATSSALSFNQRSTSIKGGIGGKASADKTNYVFTGYYQDTEDCTNANYIALKGRPVGQTHAINNHSGYVQCIDASVSIAGLRHEADAINAYLNSGIYYE